MIDPVPDDLRRRDGGGRRMSHFSRWAGPDTGAAAVELLLTAGSAVAMFRFCSRGALEMG